MRKPLRIVLLLALLTLLTLSPLSLIPTRADSPTEPPILQLFAAVPDTDLVRDNELSYTDYYALFAARPGAGQPRNYQDWNKLKEAEGNEGALTNAALFGIATGNSELLQQFHNAEKMIASVGIDPFTIERAIFYGKPPTTALLLNGTFDPDAIAKALTAKGYEEKDPGTFQLWCATEKCENGDKVNLKDRDPNNPFGGNLGRKQPIVFSPTHILSTTAFEVIAQTFMIGEKKQPSLAENPDFKAAVQAITENGTLIQAYFVNPSYLTGLDVALLSEKGAEVAKKYMESFTPLPAYSLAVFAHVVHEDKQLALVGLVYDSADDAEAAVKVLDTNLASYISVAVNRPFTELIEDREGKLEPIHIDTFDDKSVVVLTISGDLEPQEPIEGGKLYKSSGMIFHLFMSALAQRDLAWLSSTK